MHHSKFNSFRIKPSMGPKGKYWTTYGVQNDGSALAINDYPTVYAAFDDLISLRAATRMEFTIEIDDEVENG